MSRQPALTVLVPTCGRPVELHRLLTSLDEALASGLAVDVVVVDNAGGTDAVACARTCRLPLAVLSCTTPGKSVALNRGLLEARGDVVVFLDDDVTVGPDYFLQLQAALSRWPDAAGFGGRVDLAWPEGAMLPDSPLLQYIEGFAYARHFGLEEAEYPVGTEPAEANMVFRREWLAGSGTFDPGTGPHPGRYRMGSGAILFRRVREAKGRLIHLPQLVVRHHIRSEQLAPTWLQARAFSYGRSLAHHHLRHGQISGNDGLPSLALKWALRLAHEAVFALRRRAWPRMLARVDRKLIEGILAERFGRA